MPLRRRRRVLKANQPGLLKERRFVANVAFDSGLTAMSLIPERSVGFNDRLFGYAIDRE